MERPIAIVGAGVSGLAAARELRRHGVAVAVYEAADRIGGRIFTRHDPTLPLPIELGAEFLHGEAPETVRVMRAARIVIADVRGEQWTVDGGRLRRANPMPAVDRLLGRIDDERADESLSHFLARRRSTRTRRSRAKVVEFVSGFHAADPDRIGVRSIAPEPGESPTSSATEIARVPGGYDELPRWLAHDLTGTIQLGSAVRALEWRRRDVTLTVERRSGVRRENARAVIVTLPIGVLQVAPEQTAGLRIDPDPPAIRRAIGRLAMGSVTKLTIAFRDELPWARTAAEQKEDVGRLVLLHTPRGEFNVWWSTFPLRWPLAVAWSGGPAAEALGRRAPAERLASALRDLGEGLGIPASSLAAGVRAWWTHDWSRDPFARGAYSYARVGGSDAGEVLARPIDGTLFFAGEATDPASGTVEGALTSGARAARQVLETL